MTVAIFGVVFSLCLFALVERVRDRMRKTRERRAACPHPSWSYTNVYDDPRMPVRTCSDCGKQEHLKEPIPCPHCGENINQGVRLEC